MKTINPCLWFKGGAAEAVALYTSVFDHGAIRKTTKYGAAGAQVSGMKEGDVLTLDFEIAGLRIQALNGGPYYEHTPSWSLFVTCGSTEELDAIHAKLSPGGRVMMPLGDYPFSPRYVFFSDKYGIHWQLFLDEGASQKIAPCLILGGERKGRGPDAMNFYLSLFKDSRVLFDERYVEGEGGLAGSLKYARLELGGSELVIMDSGHNEAMPITGAFSLVMTCDDQREIDNAWETIAASGKEIQCGWIEDRFGVSWQVIPKGLENYVFGTDPVRAERATQAMFQMVKLDLEKIRKAYQG